jgi:outer membrane lipoprotein SlyB
VIGRAFARATLVLAVVAALTIPALGQGNVQAIRYGTITMLEPTVIEVRPSGSGAQVGATVGSVAGYALADGSDRWLGALVGGVLGGAAGRSASKGAAKKKGWQLIVKLEQSGEEIGVQVKGKKTKLKVGDRVRLMTGPDGSTQVTAVKD